MSSHARAITEKVSKPRVPSKSVANSHLTEPSKTGVNNHTMLIAIDRTSNVTGLPTLDSLVANEQNTIFVLFTNNGFVGQFFQSIELCNDFFHRIHAINRTLSLIHI